MPDVYSNMIFYSDYFAYVAEAGLGRAKAIAPAIATSISADISTIVLPVNADVARTNLSRNLDVGYELFWRDGQNLTPIQRSFMGLAEYIQLKSGLTVNAYLTEESIQVEATYANIHNIFDIIDIGSVNIKS